jgi:peroxiredoxin
LGDLNIECKVVTFDSDHMAMAYVKRMELTWPLLLDPEQVLYERYGMQSGSWWAIYGLSSIWNYMKLIFRGRLPGKPGKNWRQLGGDVLIDPDGIVRLHHLSTGPHDRPAIDSILAIVESAD